MYGKKKYPAIISRNGFKQKVYAKAGNAGVVATLKKCEQDNPGYEQTFNAVARRMGVEQSDLYCGTRGKLQVARWIPSIRLPRHTHYTKTE